MPLDYIGDHDYFYECSSTALLHVCTRTHRPVWRAHHRACMVEHAIPQKIDGNLFSRLPNLGSLTPS